MIMTYPVHYRKKALAQLEAGVLVADIIDEYKISTSTLYAWKKSLEPKIIHDRKPRTIDNEALLEDVKLYPDAYQHERASRLNCSQAGITKALKRVGITRKKSPKTS